MALIRTEEQVGEGERIRMFDWSSTHTVVQNLKDAGCDAHTIEEFLALDQEGKTKNQLDLLAKQRKRLLDRVHKEEEQIYCLDYLEFQIRKRHGR